MVRYVPHGRVDDKSERAEPHGRVDDKSERAENNSYIKISLN